MSEKCVTCEEGRYKFDKDGKPLNAKEYEGDGYQCEECKDNQFYIDCMGANK